MVKKTVCEVTINVSKDILLYTIMFLVCIYVLTLCGLRKMALRNLRNEALSGENGEERINVDRSIGSLHNKMLMGSFFAVV